MIKINLKKKLENLQAEISDSKQLVEEKIGKILIEYTKKTGLKVKDIIILATYEMRTSYPIDYQIQLEVEGE